MRVRVTPGLIGPRQKARGKKPPPKPRKLSVGKMTISLSRHVHTSKQNHNFYAKHNFFSILQHSSCP